MLHSTKSTNFCQLYCFSLLAKCRRGPDEMASRAGFGPRAAVWRTLSYVIMLFCPLLDDCILCSSASQPVGRDPLVGREAISGGSQSISKCYSFLLDREIIVLSLRNKYATM